MPILICWIQGKFSRGQHELFLFLMIDMLLKERALDWGPLNSLHCLLLNYFPAGQSKAMLEPYREYKTACQASLSYFRTLPLIVVIMSKNPQESSFFVLLYKLAA